MALTIESVVTGAVFGAATGVLGYLKNKVDPNKKDKDKKFEVGKVAPTVILTTLAGIYVFVNDLPPTDSSMALAFAGLASVGAADWIDKLLKVVLRVVKKK